LHIQTNVPGVFDRAKIDLLGLFKESKKISAIKNNLMAVNAARYPGQSYDSLAHQFNRPIEIAL